MARLSLFSYLFQLTGESTYMIVCSVRALQESSAESAPQTGAQDDGLSIILMERILSAALQQQFSTFADQDGLNGTHAAMACLRCPGLRV
jgi:hypothetical protein